MSLSRKLAITATFDGTNYTVWRKQVNVILLGLGLQNTLAGEEKRDEAWHDVSPEEQMKQLNLAYAIVFSSLNEKYQLEVNQLDSAKAIVDHVDEIHSGESPE